MILDQKYYNNEAKKLLKVHPLGYEEIRELLILTACRDRNAAMDFFKECSEDGDIRILKYLIEIASTDVGDCVRQACYYIKDYSIKILKQYEQDIINTFFDEDAYGNDFLAIALAKLKTEETKQQIIDLSKESDMLGNWIYVEAAKIYEK